MSEAQTTVAAPVCSAGDVIRSLRSRGFNLSVEGGRLVVRPASRLTPDEQASLHRHAHQIIATLKQNVENVKNVETSTALDPIATARRTWAWLLGTHPIAPGLAVDDLTTTAGDAAIDSAAAELRLALLTLAGASAWPPRLQDLDCALDQLVNAGVLFRNESGQLSPA